MIIMTIVEKIKEAIKNDKDFELKNEVFSFNVAFGSESVSLTLMVKIGNFWEQIYFKNLFRNEFEFEHDSCNLYFNNFQMEINSELMLIVED